MFKYDQWEEIKSRYNAFWEGELIDRCCASIVAPMKPHQTIYTHPEFEEEFFDPVLILERTLSKIENHYHTADAFPFAIIDLGPSGHAGYFQGVSYKFNSSSIWFNPIIGEYDKNQLIFDKTGFFYSKTLEIAKFLAENNQDRFIISMPDIAGNLDALAHLRGSEKLLMDFYDQEDEIKKCLLEIQKAWENMVTEVFSFINQSNHGGTSISFLDLFGPGLTHHLQCDISVTISSNLFKKFVLPELIAQSEIIEFPVYHLDGTEQVRHLDLIMSIEKIKMIQWTSVAGQPSPIKYIPILQKIQQNGKLLHLTLHPNEIETILENLSSKGLFLKVHTSCIDEADQVEKLLFRLTRERIGGTA